ncbi:MAG: hypothetical protein VX438_07985 [Planctomycetota bacterium]|nr:hypothetical protein [Planctomycetota bacterium]
MAILQRADKLDPSLPSNQIKKMFRSFQNIYLVVLLAFVTIGCRDQTKGDTGNSAAKEKHYSSEEIYSRFVESRMSITQLVEVLGEPDFKGTGDQEKKFWQYYNLEKSEDDGQVYNVNFLIVDGVVTYNWVTRERDAYQDTSAMTPTE